MTIKTWMERLDARQGLATYPDDKISAMHAEIEELRDRLEVLEREHSEFFDRWHAELLRRTKIEMAARDVIECCVKGVIGSDEYLGECICALAKAIEK